MIPLETERQHLYAVMRRYGELMNAPDEQLEAFLGSNAHADYRAAYQQAAHARDPATLRGLVAQMHAALDRWAK